METKWSLVGLTGLPPGHPASPKGAALPDEACHPDIPALMTLDKSLVDQCCRAIMLDIETTEVAVGSSERPVIAYAVFER